MKPLSRYFAGMFLVPLLVTAGIESTAVADANTGGGMLPVDIETRIELADRALETLAQGVGKTAVGAELRKRQKAYGEAKLGGMIALADRTTEGMPPSYRPIFRRIVQEHWKSLLMSELLRAASANAMKRAPTDGKGATSLLLTKEDFDGAITKLLDPKDGVRLKELVDETLSLAEGMFADELTGLAEHLREEKVERDRREAERLEREKKTRETKEWKVAKKELRQQTVEAQAAVEKAAEAERQYRNLMRQYQEGRLRLDFGTSNRIYRYSGKDFGGRPRDNPLRKVSPRTTFGLRYRGDYLSAGYRTASVMPVPEFRAVFDPQVNVGFAYAPIEGGLATGGSEIDWTRLNGLIVAPLRMEERIRGDEMTFELLGLHLVDLRREGDVGVERLGGRIDFVRFGMDMAPLIPKIRVTIDTGAGMHLGQQRYQAHKAFGAPTEFWIKTAGTADIGKVLQLMATSEVLAVGALPRTDLVQIGTSVGLAARVRFKAAGVNAYLGAGAEYSVQVTRAYGKFGSGQTETSEVIGTLNIGFSPEKPQAPLAK